MTTQQIINYYSNLLILQYQNQPNAVATIQNAVTPVIMNQLAQAVQGAYAIGTAVGPQLDVLGKYAGVTRTVTGFNGLSVTLSDSDFTSLIAVAVIQNSSKSSLAAIQSLLNTYFPGEMFVHDYTDMTMSYVMSSSVGSQNLAQAFVTEGLLPKPMGVALRPLVYLPAVNNLFSFRTYNNAGFNVSGFNTYSSYSMTAPWVNYNDLIFNT